MKVINDPTIGEIGHPFGLDAVNNVKYIRKLAALYSTIDDPAKPLHIFCRGSSGAIVAGLFVAELGRGKIFHVKKPGENSHYSGNFSYMDIKKGDLIIIVDDFISLGNTINSIYDYIHRLEPKLRIHAVCVTGNDYSSYLNFKPKHMVCAWV